MTSSNYCLSTDKFCLRLQYVCPRWRMRPKWPYCTKRSYERRSEFDHGDPIRPPYNVTPVTLGSREKPHSNPTDLSPTFLEFSSDVPLTSAKD
jgi:hypothetical protein